MGEEEDNKDDEDENDDEEEDVVTSGLVWGKIYRYHNARTTWLNFITKINVYKII